MNDIEPVFNRVVVKRKVVEEKTASGIILTQGAQDELKASEGEIVAVGPTVDDQFSVGDWIIWGRYAGVEVTRDRDVYVCMNDDDIIGKIKKTEGVLNDGK